MGVRNSQLTANFSAKYQLTTIFLANSQLTTNFHFPTANIIPSKPKFSLLQYVNHFWG